MAPAVPSFSSIAEPLLRALSAAAVVVLSPIAPQWPLLYTGGSYSQEGGQVELGHLKSDFRNGPLAPQLLPFS